MKAEEIVALKRQGYTLVNSGGDTLYCHADLKTGSHLIHDSTCLTGKEIVELRERTQRGLQIVTMQQLPPQAK